MTLRDDREADDEQSSMTLRESITQMMVQLRASQTLFEETGGY